MTREEALHILSIYQNWNLSEQGCGDMKKILDQRRKLILQATGLLMIKTDSNP